jgi:hypothetical protein
MDQNRMLVSVLDRLRSATTHEQLVSSLWDLRDSAYDAPELWANLSVLEILWHLAGALEDAPSQGNNPVPVTTLAGALGQSLDPLRRSRPTTD